MFICLVTLVYNNTKYAKKRQMFLNIEKYTRAPNKNI